ncbi:hypothetical protein IQ07DRAFT_108147 [Pyrenochaeta sp. DS3sAY3a]|nr:hypothetical protein IQ07DRAFT_108147 [Pyrenochaeta sp. DS3sAY3a]
MCMMLPRNVAEQLSAHDKNETPGKLLFGLFAYFLCLCTRTCLAFFTNLDTMLGRRTTTEQRNRQVVWILRWLRLL